MIRVNWLTVAKIALFVCVGVTSAAIDFVIANNQAGHTTVWADLFTPLALLSIIKGSSVILLAYLLKSPVHSKDLIAEFEEEIKGAGALSTKSRLVRITPAAD